jgi:probable F420-dependent oxidoreductase
VKIDQLLMGDLEDAPARARECEEQGFDAAISVEAWADPFFPLALAAEHTQRIELMTSIAVAFARTPMTLAYIGHDLNAYSKGRLILGLGSQIEAHIAKRFSMPWSRPAARMREFILAMRAIWDCWHEGTPLSFRGDFYSHTLMTPMFTPKNTQHGPPRVFLAAVGPRMTEVAGEVADGMIVHSFTTARYLREVTLPAVERGLARAGRERGRFELSCPVLVVTGTDERGWKQSRTDVARQIAFYGSTPAYRRVLELHGWGAVQPELNHLSKRGLWKEMGERISDEMLQEIAVVAEPNEVAARLVERYGGLIDRVTCMVRFASEAERLAYLEELRSR